MNRRKFLQFGAAGAVSTLAGGVALLSWSPRVWAATVVVDLNAVRGSVAMIDGTSAFVWSYSETGTALLPGPTILCQEGDNIVINLNNELGVPVALNVGRAGVRAVAPAGATVQLTFPAPAAGTYLYYDDQNEGVNRILGLAGTLVVMPAGIKNQSFTGGPTFVRQYKWVFGAVDPAWGSVVQAKGDAAVTQIDPASYLPRYFLINGHSFDATSEHNTELYGLVGDAALVRILNGGGMVHSPHFHGNHIDLISVNGNNYASDWKVKDIVPMLPMDVKDVIYPFNPPGDAWPAIGSAQANSSLDQYPQVYPMHCHSEMSQTAGGGLYPNGLHCPIHIGALPPEESDLSQAVAALP
ncbi:MAG: multicopper oxidase domain-containing protein [Acidiferrobacterales bacterium]